MKFTYIRALELFKTILLTLLVFDASSQNLVPNPSFETFTSCPTGQAQIYKAVSWMNFGGSPDYFNLCDPLPNNVSVPKNSIGFQNPYSGNSYGCVATFADFEQNVREFIGIQLIDSLLVGSKYFLSFKISPAYINYPSSYGLIFTNNFGALFTTYKLDSSIAAPTNNYHINNSTIVNDTATWFTIKGSFIADSNYKYVALGNFLDSSFIAVDSSYLIGSNCTFKEAYYYVDHVCVTTDSIYNESFANEITEISTDINLNIFPNPTENYLFIKSENALIQKIIFYDLFGRIIYSPLINEIIDIQMLSEGIYFLKIQLNNEETITKQIIKK